MTHAVRLSETLNDNQRFSAAVAGNNSYLLILILTMLDQINICVDVSTLCDVNECCKLCSISSAAHADE